MGRQGILLHALQRQKRDLLHPGAFDGLHKRLKVSVYVCQAGRANEQQSADTPQGRVERVGVRKVERNEAVRLNVKLTSRLIGIAHTGDYLKAGFSGGLQQRPQRFQTNVARCASD